jgi:hypothetical protein
MEHIAAKLVKSTRIFVTFFAGFWPLDCSRSHDRRIDAVGLRSSSCKAEASAQVVQDNSVQGLEVGSRSG